MSAELTIEPAPLAASLRSDRTDIEFDCHGETIHAWHYLSPSSALQGRRGRPLVVMGHGLSMTRDGGLAQYAEAFAAAGCDVLVIEYRCFGDSGGEPRELVSVKRQLQDYAAAVEVARRLDGIDPGRIALWGTSYSGGHVLELAYRDRRIAAVISQVPNIDSLATLRHLVRRMPARRMLWLVAAIVLDATRGLLRRPPFYVRSIAPDGERAAYVSTQAWNDVQKIKGPNFKNRFAPRDFLSLPPPRPIRRVDKLPCRVLFIAAECDDLTPAAPVLAAAERAGDRAELLRYPIGHFGAYVEPTISDALPKQVDFLVRELIER